MRLSLLVALVSAGAWAGPRLTEAEQREVDAAAEQLKDSLVRTNRECGTSLSVEADWASFAGQLELRSPSGMCTMPVEWVRINCRDDAGKQAAKELKKLTCRFGGPGRQAFTLKDGVLAYVVDFDESNIDQFLGERYQALVQLAERRARATVEPEPAARGSASKPTDDDTSPGPEAVTGSTGKPAQPGVDGPGGEQPPSDPSPQFTPGHFAALGGKSSSRTEWVDFFVDGVKVGRELIDQTGEGCRERHEGDPLTTIGPTVGCLTRVEGEIPDGVYALKESSPRRAREGDQVRIKGTIPYRGGKRNGAVVQYLVACTAQCTAWYLGSEVQYVGGKRNGTSRGYMQPGASALPVSVVRDGRARYLMTYKDDLLDGPATGINPINGDLNRWEGTYTKGKRVGTFKAWWDSGKLRWTTKYEGGQAVETSYFDQRGRPVSEREYRTLSEGRDPSAGRGGDEGRGSESALKGSPCESDADCGGLKCRNSSAYVGTRRLKHCY